MNTTGFRVFLTMFFIFAYSKIVFPFEHKIVLNSYSPFRSQEVKFEIPDEYSIIPKNKDSFYSRMPELKYILTSGNGEGGYIVLEALIKMNDVKQIYFSSDKRIDNCLLIMFPPGFTFEDKVTISQFKNFVSLRKRFQIWPNIDKKSEILFEIFFKQFQSLSWLNLKKIDELFHFVSFPILDGDNVFSEISFFPSFGEDKIFINSITFFIFQEKMFIFAIKRRFSEADDWKKVIEETKFLTKINEK